MSDSLLARRRSVTIGLNQLAARAREIANVVRAAPPWAHGPIPANPGDPHRPEFERVRSLLDELRHVRAVRDQLELESDECDLGVADPAKAEASAVDWLNSVSDADAMLAETVIDPLRHVGQIVLGPGLDRATAAAVLGSKVTRPAGKFASLDDLAGVPGVTALVRADFVYTGYLRLRPKQLLSQNYLVVLPARLETRFYPPETGEPQWRLRVRVVPDEPWFDRHNPLPSAAELASVDAFWAQVPDGVNTDRGAIAWGAFAGRHGGARAAWLARTFPPTPPGGGVLNRPVSNPDEPAVVRLRGLPEKLEVWLARGGAEAAMVAELNLRADGLALGLGDPNDPTAVRWWASWDKAVEVGLAVEIKLGTAEPNDIDVLYVVGIGREKAAGLFASHAMAGRLAMIEPGTPTNTVAGAPAADLGRSAESWQSLVGKPALGEPATESLSQLFTGRPDLLGPLPGGAVDHPTASRTVAAALWPALWGHAWKNLSGLGAQVNDVGLWASRYLCPEGPLPPIRIGDQPYGLVPVAALRRWTASPADPPWEDKARDSIMHAVTLAAAAAEVEGTVEGADAQRFLDLVGRVPTSARYAYRWFLPLELVRLIYKTYGKNINAADLLDWWRDTAEAWLKFPVAPPREYATLGWPQDLVIPLVEPPKWPPGLSLKETVRRLLEARDFALVLPGQLREIFGGPVPNSLLVRLLLHSLVVSAAEVGRRALGATAPALDSVFASAATDTWLVAGARASIPAETARPTPEAAVYASVRAAAQQLPDLSSAVLERALRATLDCASHRVDPWVMGLAWRRLRRIQEVGAQPILGLYAWVDRPQPGKPGPTAGGLLHAPSADQALAASILRDKAIHDPQADRWKLNLRSDTIRIVDWLGQQVRLGSHVTDVVGREIERQVGATATIAALRTAFPVRDEHKGRRTVDGEAVLRANPDTLPLTAEQKAALEPLRDALNAYGDLLVAEAVYDVVTGRTGIAGVAMDAAAGLGRPPSLEVIRTHRTGRSVETAVIVALPTAAAADGAGPATLADPAVSAFIRDRFGLADGPNWTWQLELNDNTIRSVTLRDLGLDPIDAVILSESVLRRLIETEQGPGSIKDESKAWETLRLARQIVGLMGSNPALPADLGQNSADDGIRIELANRLLTLRQAASNLRAQLEAAIVGTDDDRRTALRAALRWAIKPLRDDDALPDPVTRARDAIAARLHAAPPVNGDRGQELLLALPLAEQATRIASRPARAIAEAIAALAAPEGPLAVLGRLAPAGGDAFSAQNSDDVGLSPIDRDWLSVVAGVRPPLARLEAVQLESAIGRINAPLRTWSTRPDDPWQTKVEANTNGQIPSSRIVVAFGPPSVLDGLDAEPSRIVAAGLLDNWGETVPDAEQATAAAFGFNAPHTRAPQAILLVPPLKDGTPLTTDDLVAAIKDVRLLARARAVTPAGLSAVAAGAPTMMFSADGPTAVQLNPT